MVHLDEHSPHAHIIGVPIGRGYKRGMEKQAAKTKVFTQETLKTLRDQMHKHAERDMEAHPEIFEGESLKEIEQGRNSNWSKEFYIRQKRPEIEENVRKSVLGMLANYKKQVAEESRIRPVPVKNKGMNRD